MVMAISAPAIAEIFFLKLIVIFLQFDEVMQRAQCVYQLNLHRSERSLYHTDIEYLRWKRVFHRNTQNGESFLQHAEDPFDHVAKLCMS